jgi:hypothetical protein
MKLSGKFRKSGVVLGGGIVFAATVFSAVAKGQDSLPFDIDLATDATEEVTEAQTTEAPEAQPVEASSDIPAPPQPLADPSETAEPQGATPAAEQIPSDPEITSPTEESGLSTVNSPDVTNFLVGRKVDAVISELERDGWMVITQTPGLVQLDRGQMGLDLTIDNTTREVIQAELAELI